MKLSIKKYKSSSGKDYFIISDWYWYNCGLYNSQEKAEEEVIINILEEEKLRRQNNQIKEEVVFELRDNEIRRIEDV